VKYLQKILTEKYAVLNAIKRSIEYDILLQMQHYSVRQNGIGTRLCGSKNWNQKVKKWKKELVNCDMTWSCDDAPKLSSDWTQVVLVQVDLWNRLRRAVIICCAHIKAAWEDWSCTWQPGINHCAYSISDRHGDCSIVQIFYEKNTSSFTYM